MRRVRILHTYDADDAVTRCRVCVVRVRAIDCHLVTVMMMVVMMMMMMTMMMMT